MRWKAEVPAPDPRMAVNHPKQSFGETRLDCDSMILYT